METPNNEKPALLIIDMVKDYFDDSKQLPITPFAREIIDRRIQKAPLAGCIFNGRL